MKKAPEIIFILLASTIISHSELAVKVGEPTTMGTKSITKLTIKNAFKEKVESARAHVFLSDESGRVIGQAANWVIGGKKDRPTLPPNQETEFNFVVPLPSSTTSTHLRAKVTFTRVMLEGGKSADVAKEVSINPAVK